MLLLLLLEILLLLELPHTLLLLHCTYTTYAELNTSSSTVHYCCLFFYYSLFCSCDYQYTTAIDDIAAAVTITSTASVFYTYPSVTTADDFLLFYYRLFYC